MLSHIHERWTVRLAFRGPAAERHGQDDGWRCRCRYRPHGPEAGIDDQIVDCITVAAAEISIQPRLVLREVEVVVRASPPRECGLV